MNSDSAGAWFWAPAKLSDKGFDVTAPVDLPRQIVRRVPNELPRLPGGLRGGLRAGRGLADTLLKTRNTGYLVRRLVNAATDIPFPGGASAGSRGVGAIARRGASEAARRAAKRGAAAAAKEAGKKAAAAAGKQAGKKAASAGPKGVPILDAAMLVSTALELLVGPGTSEKGQDIELAAESFEAARSSLAKAMADASLWSGEASETYNARNGEQIERAVTVVHIDQQLAAVVHRQADKVHDVSIAMLICGLSLIAAVPVAIGLRAIPIVGEAVSLAFQSATAVAILAAEAAELGIMGQAASDNATEISALARQYQDLGDGAYLRGSTDVMVAFSVDGQASIDPGDVSTTSSLSERHSTASGGVMGHQARDATPPGVPTAGLDWFRGGGEDFGAAGAIAGAGVAPEPARRDPQIGGWVPSTAHIASPDAGGSRRTVQSARAAATQERQFNGASSSFEKWTDPDGVMSAEHTEGTASDAQNGDRAPVAETAGAAPRGAVTSQALHN